ncbi:hypothetical protein VTL71DRAFT_1954 [Oculimacula yallundae]|uniref:SGNH hydrolase-type esterase domain-containing protein n=1 Tax=Oculimacula yallundae TaxID=86028 RepID=A0ABR4CC93_9HELO
MFTLRLKQLLPYLFLLLSSSTVHSLPSLHYEDQMIDQSIVQRQVTSQSVSVLRVLCLGASIVYGYDSTDGNGFRRGLRGALIKNGLAVNMVGALRNGNMTDNDVAGYIGYRIDQVQGQANATGNLPSMPNVVLLHIGLNDMGQNYNVPTAHQRLASLVNGVFAIVPGVAVVVSTLLPNSDPATEANIQSYNAQIPGVVNDRIAQGKKITMVDFHSDWFSTADLHADNHPTDFGYLKMAKVWYNGITALQSQITPPIAVAEINDTAATQANDPGEETVLDVVCPPQPAQNTLSLPTAGLSACGNTATFTVSSTSRTTLRTSSSGSSSQRLMSSTVTSSFKSSFMSSSTSRPSAQSTKSSSRITTMTTSSATAKSSSTRISTSTIFKSSTPATPSRSSTATPTSSTPSCFLVSGVAKPVPAGATCGATGFGISATGAGRIPNASYSTGSPYVASIKACGTQCLTFSNCTNVFFQQGQACNLHYGPDAFMPSTASGYFYFYDAQCFSCKRLTS